MTIKAKIIADSVAPDVLPWQKGIRLTTMQLRYPRFIHSEMMTHRQFSRNASSSRAVPVEKLIKDIQEDTAMPIYWGKNQPGMQANEECNETINLHSFDNLFIPGLTREEAWCAARDRAIENAKSFHKAGYHKQIVNRLLEPFSHINVVVSSTEWSNFFALRIHPSAQPEIQQLARSMKLAMDTSQPKKLKPGEWHLPYITDEDINILLQDTYPQDEWVNTAIKCSVARCARVSYMTHEMKKPTVEEDLKLYERLLGAQPIHASPAEHQATPDEWLTSGLGDLGWKTPDQHGNFKGWIQYRKTLEGECQ